MTTLYRKYRPSVFSEISGQKYVLQTLTNAIKNSQVSHAYLFTGPRGTGKTTTARIFAKTINCLHPITKTKLPHIGIEPCNKCLNCQMIIDNRAIDLIEIDAASHTGVDNIRQLKEAINTPPTNFKYKVYIIDEVHMLSLGAFNALLKTLEEPPAHAIFILATTELHKVPTTIISRCQQFNIKPLTKNQIIKRLGKITKKEKIKISKKSLNLIATEAGGGMRDAESLLGQIISLGDKKIVSQSIQQTLGIPPRETLSELIVSLSENNISAIITIINKLQENGTNLKSFSKQLLNYFRNMLLIKIAPDSNNVLKNLTSDEITELKNISNDFQTPNLITLISLVQDSLNKSNQSDIPQLPLEMALIKYFTSSTTQSTNSTNQIKTSLKKKITPAKNSAPQQTNSKLVQKNKLDKTTITTNETPVSKNSLEKIDISINSFLDSWAEITEDVRKKSQSTAGFLKNCAPVTIQDNIVLIKANYAFNKDKLNDPPTKLTIEKIFAKILKVPLRVKFLTEDELPKEAITHSSEKENTNTSSENNNELLYETMKKIGGKIIKK